MAVNNPMGNFDFLLALSFVQDIRVQVITRPKIEYTEHKGGSPGNAPDKKTPGKKIVGDLVVQCQVPNTGDGEIYDALRATGTMQRELYAGDGFLYETVGQIGVPVQTYRIANCWLKSIETTDNDRQGDNSANTMRTLTFSVEDFDTVV